MQSLVRKIPLYVFLMFMFSRTLASLSIFLDDVSFIWVLCVIGPYAIFGFLLGFAGYKSDD